MLGNQNDKDLLSYRFMMPKKVLEVIGMTSQKPTRYYTNKENFAI